MGIIVMGSVRGRSMGKVGALELAGALELVGGYEGVSRCVGGVK